MYKSRRKQAILRAALCVMLAFSLAFSCTLSRMAMADTPDSPAKTTQSGTMTAGKTAFNMPCHNMPQSAPDESLPDNGTSKSSTPDCCKIMCHALLSVDVALAAPYQHPKKLLPGAPDWPEDADPGDDSPPPRPTV